MNTLRKWILTAAAVLAGTLALAIPAQPGVFTYTQPDGSIVRLERHGDEFFHWTTLAGTDQAVALDADGYWRPVQLNFAALGAARERRHVANAMRRAARSTHNDDPMTHGERHIPVFLVNFTDVKFTISNPATKFKNLLNQKGYSDNGATGSVQDFYVDNSHGAFKPIFDIYGPVTLSHEMKYYGGNSGSGDAASDLRPQDAVSEAAQLLNSQVDFSQYDYDNDGYVDMVLMYYAGYNEAEGGPEDSIWPHQWSVPNSPNLDGKLLGAYFCTSELRGGSGTTMCGIGTTCHEFGHSLGLPDFYDTDYSRNGSAGGLYSFSTMCSGSYNNNGRTPPYFNSEERIMLGWMADSDVPTLPEGKVSVGPVQNDIAYRSKTETSGEYFLYEFRDGTGWDAYLPKGLLVYHVDKATSHYVGGVSAYHQWLNWTSYNKINAYGDHPCFYVVPAADQQNLNYDGSLSSTVFPGSHGVTTFAPVDWDKNYTDHTLSDISVSSEAASFTVTYSTAPIILGSVKGVDGKPVPDVYVTLSEPGDGAKKNTPRLLRAPERRLRETTTSATGSFTISLEGYEGTSVHLTFAKDGWQTQSVDLDLTDRKMTIEVILKQIGEGEEQTFSYFDPSGSLYYAGYADYGNSQMTAIRIPAASLPADGGYILSVTVMPYTTAKAYYIVVDAGEERLFTGKNDVLGKGGTASLVTVDMDRLEFPGGSDLYVGLAVQEAQAEYSGYPFIVASGFGETYYAPFSLTQSSWGAKESSYDAIITVKTLSRAEDPGQGQELTLADMGFNAIADPGRGRYTAGSAFALSVQLAEGVSLSGTIAWKLDGQSVASGAKSVTLSAGAHILTATCQYTDGTTETLELRLVAE